MIGNEAVAEFQKTVRTFYKKHKRIFPWRSNPTPYFVVVSEIMLQQTQANRVVGKFNDFVKHFPNFKKLAEAKLPEVLKHWQGLGYNRRAKSLHELAKIVTKKYNGKLPSETMRLTALPGIGPYTTAAVQSFAFNLPSIVIETNIRTVYIFHFFNHRKNKITDAELLPLIQKTIYRKNPRMWYSALMDYGSYLKKQHGNASQKSTVYSKQSSFRGSNRQARGAIIRELSRNKRMTIVQLAKCTDIELERIQAALLQLQKENLIVKKARSWQLAD